MATMLQKFNQGEEITAPVVSFKRACILRNFVCIRFLTTLGTEIQEGLTHVSLEICKGQARINIALERC